MTTPSEPTPPTLEQRAATINDLCPEGWSVRPSGSSLAIVNPNAPDAPPAVIHSDDAAIVATIWTWHTRALEIEAHERGRLRLIVNEIAAVFGCPGDIDSLPAKVRAMDELHAPGGEVGKLRTELERLRTDEARQVADAVQWCTVNAGRGLAAELAQDAARRLKTKLSSLSGTITVRWAIAQALHIGAETTIEWADGERSRAPLRTSPPLVTPESRLAAVTAERDEFWTTLRAIGLRDSESLEEFEARMVSEGQEARRDNRADLEAMRELQKARNDLRVYEMDSRSLSVLADQAEALFKSVPESLEVRSYDIYKGATIAVRITRDPKRVRVETTPGDPVARAVSVSNVSVGMDLRSADPEKLAAVLSTPIGQRVKADINRPAAKPERNVLDEVRRLGEATERFDRAALGASREGKLAAEQAAWMEHLADSARELGEAEGRFEDIDVRVVRVLRIPAAVIAAMFPLARRMVVVDQAAIVTGDDPRLHIVNADIPHSREQEQAAVVISVMPTGEINVLKNRQDGRLGLITPVKGVSFAEMVWTGSAWAPTKPPVAVAVGESEAGQHSKQEAVDAGEYGARFAESLELDIEGAVRVCDGRVVTGVDGPVPTRAPGWTGITWMSGKGRAKSLTLPGLRQISVTGVGDKARLRVDPEAFTDKAKRVFNKAWKQGRLLTFHLPGGMLKRATVHAIATSESPAHGAVPGDIFVDLPKPETTQKRQGIAWRRPGHDVDSFAEVPIRPTFDATGNNVIEVHADLPEDLQHEIRQTSRDRPTITVTTVNGATLKGPIAAWMRQASPEGVLWRLTMPQTVPLPT